MAIMFALPVNGEVGRISEDWKAHFKATPVIENCVFERKLFSGEGKPKLYQFRCQDDAFLFRQIRSLNDVLSNNIPTLGMYAGRYGSNCWAIDWSADGFGTLKLFPNADKIWRKPPDSGDATLVYLSERQLFSALYYGIGDGDLDPTTIEWLEESKFTARSVVGQKIHGEIIKTHQGYPTVLEWRFDGAPDPRFRFVMEYKYDVDFELTPFPSEIKFSNNSKDYKGLGSTTKILILKTSSTHLDESFFDPRHYFVKPVSQRSSTFVFSNNESYNISSGKPQKLLPLNMMPSLETGERAERPSTIIRYVVIGICVMSAMGLLYFWKKSINNGN